MIPRLEPTRQFVDRLVLLNRFHAPDEDGYEDARHALAMIHRGFPQAPVHEQAAYLVARIAQQRPFAEANFRTAWDYVCDLLTHRGYDIEATYKDAQELGNRVWDISDGGDDAIEELVGWFRPRIHGNQGSGA